jgi:hypothetical protein
MLTMADNLAGLVVRPARSRVAEPESARRRSWEKPQASTIAADRSALPPNTSCTAASIDVADREAVRTAEFAG